MKHPGLYIMLLTCWLQPVRSQSPALDEAAFRSMSPPARFRFVHDYPFAGLDATGTANVLDRMLAIVQQEKDARAYAAVKFRRYVQREILKMSTPEILLTLSDMEQEARKNHLEVETVAGHLYFKFEQFKYKKIPTEQMYAEVQIAFGKMEALGFDRFQDYKPEAMFYILIKFMQDLEDYEESYRYLSAAERVLVPTGKNYAQYTLFLNYLQSYWQRKKDYKKALEYAQKILHFNQHLPPDATDPEAAWRAHFWQGFSSLSIAEMMLEQGRREEVERYADQGYAWSRVETPGSPRAAYIAEYEALQVYIPIKLEFGKLAEAGALLKRSEELKEMLGVKWDISIFKHIKFYENFARYEEMCGRPAEALRYTKLARGLQDSLDRQNDIRKFEQINQRLAAEKYTEQLRLVEDEKELQEQLRNAAFVLLALVLALSFAWFQRQRRLRLRKELELEAAHNDLVDLTQRLREKAELLENLRAEISDRSATGERSQYLEQLLTSMILTEEDWRRFRAVFEKVHPHFIKEQKDLYPGLTPAELRYLVLEHLELSTHEMASMLGVSDNTIRQTRARLRRKTG